jgi:hypothetical protein
MKLRDLFKAKRPIGWQGHGGEPSPVVIGAVVALIIAGAYVLLMMFGHKS